MNTNLALMLAFVVLTTQFLQAQRVEIRGEWIRVLLSAGQPERDVVDGETPTKCGTALIALAYNRWGGLTAQTQATIQQALQRPIRNTSRLSPSGRFRIHYDTSGVHAPALLSPTNPSERTPNSVSAYIDSVASVFDHCWEVEVNKLGYRPPPQDGGQGGGPEYDVYVSELSSNEFGSTNWTEGDLISSSPNEKYTTYIIIDNDYLGYRTRGMDGLKVTAAHEFHHAIQMGAYGKWPTVPNSDFYFYELTSTWMEDIVYTQINDYYFDVPIFFQGFRDGLGRSYSFTRFDHFYFGYERSVWGHFLARRFGADVMREVWEGMRSEPCLKSTQSLLMQRGTDLSAEFTLFTTWNYFTDDRADTVKYYPEGKNYPRFKPNAAATFSGSSVTVNGGAYPLSSQLMEFQLSSDTVSAAITNLRIDQAQQGTGSVSDFQIRLTAGVSSSAYQALSNGLKAEFSVLDIANWRTQYLQASTRADAGTNADPSPNPLRMNQASRLVLPVSGTAMTEAEVFFLSSSLDLLFSGRYPIREEFGKRYIVVPTNDFRSHVSSGIHFIAAHTSDADFRWKVAIIQ